MGADQDAAGSEKPVLSEPFDDPEVLRRGRHAACGDGHSRRRCQRLLLPRLLEVGYQRPDALVVRPDVGHATLLIHVPIGELPVLPALQRALVECAAKSGQGISTLERLSLGKQLGIGRLGGQG